MQVFIVRRFYATMHSHDDFQRTHHRPRHDVGPGIAARLAGRRRGHRPAEYRPPAGHGAQRDRGRHRDLRGHPPNPTSPTPLGTVHGGICATLLDSVMGCAVHTTLPAGVGYTTLELKVNYIRTVAVDAGELTGVGTVIHAGRTTATAEGKVYSDDGKLVAHGTTTCIVFR